MFKGIASYIADNADLQQYVKKGARQGMNFLVRQI